MKQATAKRFQSGVALRRQRGASLLEGIAYLGIAAIVVLGAVSLLRSAFGSAEANRAVEEITSIRTAVKKLFMGQAAGYGNNANLEQSLIRAGAVPTTLSTDPAANTITNAWGGRVNVVGNGINFTITYNAVPQDACVNILSGATGWTNIAVGTRNIVNFPATPAEATAACTGAANVIVLTAT